MLVTVAPAGPSRSVEIKNVTFTENKELHRLLARTSGAMSDFGCMAGSMYDACPCPICEKTNIAF